MVYRTDQWYNLAAAGETGTTGDSTNKSGAAVTDANNQKFIYPDRTIRTLRADGVHAEQTLKRGYIRNLTSENNSVGVPTSKCQFQFNPQYLVQSVSQNTSVLNFLQQEPGQYSQPMPGNVSFNFDLFFDRSMEMNQNTDAGAQDGLLTGATVNPNDPWASSPEYVGVLHDIGVFFNVIGVGINNSNNEFKQYAERFIEKRITAEINAQNADEEGSDISADEQLSTAMDQTNTFLKYNVGNTAFLLPLPVRVVFSSLYIVEGLVKDVTVTFTKFNAAMVPMQCTLNVLFEAKYIGFAKKDTFFTQVLGDLDSMELRDDFDIPDDIAREYLPAIRQDLSRVQIALARNKSAPHYSYRHYMPEKWTVSTGYRVGSHLPLLVSNDDLDDELENGGIQLRLGFPNAYEKSALLDLIESSADKEVSVSVTAQAHMWRIEDKALRSGNLANLYKEAIAATPTAMLPKQKKTTQHFTDDVREKWKKVDEALQKWSTPLFSEEVESRNGTPARFKTVYKMISGYIDDSHLIDEETRDNNNNVVEMHSTSSGYDQLQDLFLAGLTGTVSFPKTSQQGDVYDRSVGVEGYEADLYPEYNTFVQDRDDARFGTKGSSTFKFFIKYTVTVTVNVDSVSIGPMTVTDYVPIPEYGTANFNDIDTSTKVDTSYSSAKSLKFDWQSVVDESSSTAYQVYSQGGYTNSFTNLRNSGNELALLPTNDQFDGLIATTQNALEPLVDRSPVFDGLVANTPPPGYWP